MNAAGSSDGGKLRIEYHPHRIKLSGGISIVTKSAVERVDLVTPRLEGAVEDYAVVDTHDDAEADATDSAA